MDVIKAVAILGGSGGLGREVSIRVAKDAAVTIGYYKGLDRANAVVATVTSSGGLAKAEQVDISDPVSVKRFLDQAKLTWGRLDSIIMVTGPPITLGPLVDVPDNLFKSIIDTDVIGAFNVVKYGVPILQAQGIPDASLLVFLAAAVHRTTDWDGLSYIPKKCLEGIIRLTAREVGPSGIRINGIAPGVIDAGIVLTSFQADSWGERVINTVLAQTPLARMGEATEVANVAAFLISSQASYVTGQIISVDGGYSV